MNYAGWSNYPTWAVNLWMTNEYPGIPEGATPDQLKEAVEALADGVELPGMLTDLLTWAVEQVDFDEIAEDAQL